MTCPKMIKVVQVNKINISIFVILCQIPFCSENSGGRRKGKVGTLLGTISNLIILQKTVLSRTSSIEIVKSKTLLLQKTEEAKVYLSDQSSTSDQFYLTLINRMKHQHSMLKHLKQLNSK